MPKTLLLADDSVTIQKVVGISFANEDVVLLTVDNGDDAIVRAREARPDIVLADVVMPGMNGYEVCEAIKSDPQLRHIPVLLLTGTFEAFDEERAARAGADGHITKPFEAQALVDQVNARLAQVAAPAPAADPAAATEPPTPARRATSFEDTLGLGRAPGASPGAGESFDFFEEEITEPRAASAESGAETMVVGDDLGLGADASADFAFESPPGSPEEPVAEVEAGPDSTVAMLPEDDGFASAAPAPQEVVPSLGESDLEPFEAAESPQAAEAVGTLEDVSSSLPEEPVPTRILSEGNKPEFAPEPTPETPPYHGAADETRILSEIDTDPLSAPLSGGTWETAEATPAESPAPDPLAEVEPADLAAQAVLDPASGRDFDVSSSDLGDQFQEIPPSAPEVAEQEEPFLLEEEAVAEPVPEVTVEPTPDPVAAPTTAQFAADSEADLSPMSRQQLHDALERIAWDAFSDVAERIVSDALERIEKVAWEVIPQMAEALIQEEIRKLKGEDS